MSAPFVPSMEELLTGRGFIDLPASPLQRSITRAASGRPVGDGIDEDASERHFGCPRSKLGLVVPVLVVVIAGVRAGKSFLAVAGALHDVFAADCSALKSHEVPRHVIVAPTIDNADATLRILCGVIETSAVLRRMLVGPPTSDTVTLRRPDGRVVEIVVVAGSRGGITLRSRWLAGATLEEAGAFGIESAGAAVNAEELLRAAEGRLLPGTQVRIISSPFGPAGLLWTLYQAHFGKPGRVLVVHAGTRAMNPSFSQATIDAIRARDPDGAAREHDAAWVDFVTSYFDSASIRRNRRTAPDVLPPTAAAHFATMDAGTRGNAWTVTVGRETEGRRLEVALAHEWRGSKLVPLSPKATLKEIKRLVSPYGVTSIGCDQWSFDANYDLAADLGLTLVQHGTTARDVGYAELHTLIGTEGIDLPPDHKIEQDLRGVRKKLTPSGFRIDLLKTADGRHCDFAPSLALLAYVARQARDEVIEYDATYDAFVPKMRC